tara:strand:+ start:85 stop:585 length:501 start_codon:yes stop_codon:yes gene_type:complete
VTNITSQNLSEKNYKESLNPLQKVGSFIKEARLARSLSIEELSSSLRIGQEQLIALENGQEELLPERVFIRAMIRRISEKLNLETKFILDELDGRDVSIKKIYQISNTKEDTKESPNLILLMIFISGLLGVTASLFTINYLKDSKPSYSNNLNPPVRLSAQQKFLS